MATYTTNYNLEKTDDGDDWSAGYRTNLDAIDTGIKAAQDDAYDAQTRLVPVESATALIPSIQTTLAGMLSTVATAPEAYQYGGTFNSTTGTTVALPKTVSSVTDYIAYAIPTGDATNIGGIWIEKAVSQFVVKCTGADTTTGFVAIVFYVGSHDVFGSNSFRRYYASPSSAITNHGDNTATGGIAAVAKGITDASQKAALELPANGLYQFRQDFALDADVELLPQPGALIQPYMSIRSATYKWTAAVCGTDTYYLELAAGGDPSIEAPYGVYQDGTALTEGADCGSLTAGQWVYGLDPGGTFATIYIRLSDGADPDTLIADTLNAGYEITIGKLSPATGIYPWIDISLGGSVKFDDAALVGPAYVEWIASGTINQALAMLPARGGAVQLVCDGYAASEEIVIPANCTLLGMGSGAGNSNDSTGETILTSSVSSGSAISFGGHNGKMSGIKLVLSGTADIGVELNSVFRCYLNDVTVYDGDSDSIGFALIADSASCIWHKFTDCVAHKCLVGFDFTAPGSGKACNSNTFIHCSVVNVPTAPATYSVGIYGFRYVVSDWGVGAEGVCNDNVLINCEASNMEWNVYLDKGRWSIQGGNYESGNYGITFGSASDTSPSERYIAIINANVKGNDAANYNIYSGVRKLILHYDNVSIDDLGNLGLGDLNTTAYSGGNGSINIPTDQGIFRSSNQCMRFRNGYTVFSDVIDAHTDGVITFTKAGAPVDGDFGYVLNGLLAVDTTNHKLYFRSGGGWKRVDPDA